MGGKLLRRLRFQMLCLSMNWLSLIYAICFEHIHLYCSLKRQAVHLCAQMLFCVAKCLLGLGFVHGFASAVEQPAVQRTVSVPNFRYAVFVLKLRVAFLTGHQIKLFHLCIRPLFFVCQAHNVFILPRMPGLCH